MKKIFSFLLFFVLNLAVSSQKTYLVNLTDKELDKCTLKLSNYSILRKRKYGIKIDDKDYSIENYKIKRIESICKVDKISTWLNTVVVDVNDENQIKRLGELSFVKSIEFIGNKDVPKLKNKKKVQYSKSEYGEAYNQIKVHNGDIFHQDGYEGQNIKIAVFDAGYRKLDSISSFGHLFENNTLHLVSNLVYENDTFFAYSNHGTYVLGCMASYFKDSIVGSATKADYYLFITEDSRSESKIEEVNWSIAAQKADSIGVDIINSSLGYTTFDDSYTNYSYEDMNGQTAISSKAAKIASEKGILVINSAGNSGNNGWKYIGAPADVYSVISLGAIDVNKAVTNFSSRGFAYNNVIKPTVMSVGRNTVCYYHKGEYFSGNGTSFSSPLMAGLIASLWSKYPTLSPDQIRYLIPYISDRYNLPNSDYGYGIPDFNKIDEKIEALSKLGTTNFIIHPNPSSIFTNVSFNIQDNSKDYYLTLSNPTRPLIETLIPTKIGLNRIALDLRSYNSGIYFIKIFKGKELLYQGKLQISN